MCFRTERSTKASGRGTRDMDMECSNGQMELGMKGFGWTTKLMGKEHFIM